MESWVAQQDLTDLDLYEQCFEGLKFNSNYGIDRLRSENITYLSPNLGSSAFATGGSATNISALRNNYNFTNSLSFDRRFAEKRGEQPRDAGWRCA